MKWLTANRPTNFWRNAPSRLPAARRRESSGKAPPSVKGKLPPPAAARRQPSASSRTWPAVSAAKWGTWSSARFSVEFWAASQGDRISHPSRGERGADGRIKPGHASGHFVMRGRDPRILPAKPSDDLVLVIERGVLLGRLGRCPLLRLLGPRDMKQGVAAVDHRQMRLADDDAGIAGDHRRLLVAERIGDDPDCLILRYPVTDAPVASEYPALRRP